jgi:hypothetical protein
LFRGCNDPPTLTVYTTASISPAPNALITLAVLGHRAYGANPSPVVTGGGMTAWEEVATTTFDPLSGPLKRVTIYRAMSVSPGSGPITISFENSVSNAQWIVSQWQGVDLTGENGSGAIVQTGSARADAVNGLTVTLASFENANNVAYGAAKAGLSGLTQVLARRAHQLYLPGVEVRPENQRGKGVPVHVVFPGRGERLGEQREHLVQPGVLDRSEDEAVCGGVGCMIGEDEPEMLEERQHLCQGRPAVRPADDAPQPRLLDLPRDVR